MNGAGFGFFERRRRFPEPRIKLLAEVQDEAVALVQRLPRARDLDDFNSVLRLPDVQKFGDEGPRLDMIEPRLDPTGQVLNVLEQLLKRLSEQG